MKPITLMSTAAVALFYSLHLIYPAPIRKSLRSRILVNMPGREKTNTITSRTRWKFAVWRMVSLTLREIASWSSAKKSDPQRSVNTVADVWNSDGPGRTLVTEFQTLDTTLRTTEVISGHVIILHLNIDEGTLSWPTKSDGKSVYTSQITALRYPKNFNLRLLPGERYPLLRSAACSHFIPFLHSATSLRVFRQAPCLR